MTPRLSSLPRRELISILLIDCDLAHMAGLLESIFRQEDSENFEVIVVESRGNDALWEAANIQAQRHPGRLTLFRSPSLADGDELWKKALGLARGKYYVRLSGQQSFDPDGIRQAIAAMDRDLPGGNAPIGRVMPHHDPQATLRSIYRSRSHPTPLVSICVYNYNYGRYLGQCLDSIAKQTYGNLEVCFSDNASTDESWRIAVDFFGKSSLEASLIRNRANHGATANLNNTLRCARGKYLLLLCSDDAMHPNFVSRCVDLLENNPEAAFALVHRDILDETGNLAEEPPFYDRTCLIDGEEQAAVYMMAAVNPSISQVLYRHESILAYPHSSVLTERWFGQRLMDFALCQSAPIIYVKEPLLLNRVHGQSDGAAIDTSLVQSLGQYMLALQFSETAARNGLAKPAARLGAAIEKVSRLCLRYCLRFHLCGDADTAWRYLHLAQALWPDVREDATFLELERYQYAEAQERPQLIAELTSRAGTARQSSYAPPPGSIPL